MLDLDYWSYSYRLVHATNGFEHQRLENGYLYGFNDRSDWRCLLHACSRQLRQLLYGDKLPACRNRTIGRFFLHARYRWFWQ